MLAEIVVVVALMLSTEFIASDQWALDNQSWPTTLWATNATISAAILLGPIPGMLTGVVVMIASTVVKGFINYDLGRNATIVIELAVGLAVGMAAQTARRAHAELERATGSRRRWRNATGCRARCTTARSRCLRWCPGAGAKSAERQRNWPSWPVSCDRWPHNRSARHADERHPRARWRNVTGRQVHDGAIQSLFPRQSGDGIGRAGCEQERRCGGWSAPQTPSRGRSDGRRRGAAAAASVGPVSVSVPANPVLLDAGVADELHAAAANALDNVASHAGPDARAYVLLEDLGDSVTVSIRDDGVGIADGRLEEAVARRPRRSG